MVFSVQHAPNRAVGEPLARLHAGFIVQALAVENINL